MGTALLKVAVLFLAMAYLMLNTQAVTSPDLEPAAAQSVSGKTPPLPSNTKSGRRKSSRRISPSILRAYCAILRSTARMDLWERYCSAPADVTVLRR